MIETLLGRFRALPDNLKGALLLLLAALGFTVMTILVKLLGSRLHVTQILFVRQVGMTLMVAPTLVAHFPMALKTRRPGLQIARIACALVAMLAGFTAVIHLPLAEATAIGFAKSFFTTLFAIMILGEVVRIRRWSATIVGFLGVLLMLQPGTVGFSIYGVYALVGAAAAGMVMILIRLMSRSDAPVTILTYQAVGVGLIMAVPAFLYWQWPTPMEWGLLALVGIASFYAQTLNIHAYKHGEASLLASLDYVRLLYATVLGFLVFGNLPGLQTWLGAGVVVLASVYTVHREATLRKRREGG